MYGEKVGAFSIMGGTVLITACTVNQSLSISSALRLPDKSAVKRWNCEWMSMGTAGSIATE